MKKTYLTWDEVHTRYRTCIPLLCDTVYGVPRGGMLAAAMVHVESPLMTKHCVCRAPVNAEVIFDDIIDSGCTREKYQKLFPNKPFVALVDKTKPEDADLGWVVFPWETEDIATNRDGLDTAARMLELIGEDPRREGLLETPARIVKTWGELYSGYHINPESVFKVFEQGACDEMVLLRSIEFFSTCEHHMLPFHGKAHIAYIPDGRVIGVSKLARLLDVFARRMQIQERIGQQVTEALDKHLMPRGSACILEAQHFCMTSRGVQKQNSVMVTSSLTGVFRSNAAARAELMSMIRG